MKGVSIKKIGELVAKFLRRFHVLIFTIIVAGCLVFVILTLNYIVTQSSNTNGDTPPTGNAQFDKATINRINKLKSPDESATPIDSSGRRTNPFVE